MGSSYIILKTNGTGNISIISKSYKEEYPNEIYIMKENNWHSAINEVTKGIFFGNLESNINSFKLVWSKEINSTSDMFSYCKKIIEINLANFNSSLVKTMMN